MRTIRFLEGETHWPYLRQTPRHDGMFGASQFFIGPGTEPTDWLVVLDRLPEEYEASFDRARSLFIAREPAGGRPYHPQFLQQFGALVTSDLETMHPNPIFTQPGLPWRAGMRPGDVPSYHRALSFAELEQPVPKKTKLCSVILQAGQDTPGELLRFEFTAKLKAAFGAKLDYFGPGGQPLTDQDEALLPYRYHIAIESAVADDYWSDALADAYLRGCFPIYGGAPNITRYFAGEAMVRIDMAEPRASIARIAGLLNEETDQQASKALEEAKRRVLWEYNLFAVIDRLTAEFERSLPLEGRPEKIRSETAVRAHYGDRPLASLIPRAFRSGGAGAREMMGQANAERLARLLRAGADRLMNWSEQLVPPAGPTPRDRMLAAWASAEGDKTMRLEYPLGPADIVVDADGGDGQWASDVVARYGSTVHVFEPVPGLAETIGARLGANPLIKLHAATLGRVDGQLEISVDGGQTSPKAKLRIEAIGPQSLFSRGHFEEIALLKLSLGGREYDFLDALLSAGLMGRIADLQVQFTDFGPEATVRLQAIQRLLRETHEITYQYPFLWENWRRRSRP